MRLPLPTDRTSRWSAAAALAAVIVLSAPTTAPAAVAAPALATATAPATAVDSTTGAEWTVQPADADGPDGRVSLRHVVDPGETVHDAIALTNLASAPTTFDLRAGDGVVGADGAFDLRTDAPTGSGSWLSVGGLDDDTLTLEPGETQVLPLTLTVPADATPGDHPAGVVAAVSRASEGVTVTHRVGVRLHLQVAGEITPALTVRDVEASFDPSAVPFLPGNLQVRYTVANTGNVRLGAAVTTETGGPFGTAPVAHSGAVDELLPGDESTRTVTVRAWPLFMLGGDVTATALRVGEDQVDALPTAAVAAFGVTAVPWLELLTPVLVTVLVLLVRHVRRSRRRRGAVSPDRRFPCSVSRARVAPSG